MITGRARRIAKPPAAGKLRVLKPLAPVRKLARALAERLRADIAAGRLAQGARLPTEQQIAAQAGVSRPVVREAIAALRAEGLVVTRQGVGAFVGSESLRRPFWLDPAGLHSVAEVLDVMELRAGVEVAAAGLAAERASAAGRRAIAAALRDIDAAIARGETAVDEDFRFHRAIAAATGNGQMAKFLDFLGRLVIPRHTLRAAGDAPAAQRAYLERVHREHHAINAAIATRDAPAARAAMQRHLENSRARYRTLAALAA